MLKEEFSNVMRVKMMNNRGLESYARKGIPEAVLLHAAGMFERAIESSAFPGRPMANSCGSQGVGAALSVGKCNLFPETDTYRTVV